MLLVNKHYPDVPLPYMESVVCIDILRQAKNNLGAVNCSR
jgi:hypothetical protein